MLKYEFIKQLLWLILVIEVGWSMPVALRARGRFVWNGVWNWMIISSLSLLKFVCTIYCNYVLIDAMKYTSGIVFTQTVGVKNLPFAWCTWWPLSDITINYKIKVLFVVNIYIYHIFTNESLTSNSSVALPTIDIYE